MNKKRMNLRIRSDLVEKLKKESKLSGETQTLLLEECLDAHLKAKSRARALARKAAIEADMEDSK